MKLESVYNFATLKNSLFPRNLRKHKVTRIHMNLFASMIIQSLVRLVIYIDQLVVREGDFSAEYAASGGGANATAPLRGIDNTVSLLCAVESG